MTQQNEKPIFAIYPTAAKKEVSDCLRFFFLPAALIAITLSLMGIYAKVNNMNNRISLLEAASRPAEAK